ncbi:hypothetical protein GGP57_002252 [Salinibacter ruber]|nr:hypothetical protein [Salinibacter ruber]MCS3714606.1 hypothetical protein [Salinibacter ruber]
MGLDRTRWTLGLLARKMEAIGDIPDSITRGGFSKLLGRLGISYKRGRQRMRSPDPDYEEKRQYAAERLQEARTDPDVTLLYLDECGYEKIPSLDRGYEAKGEKQPTAAPSQSSNQQMRVAACLNATTGTVHARRAEETGRQVLLDLYREVVDCYSGARVIYVVQDNWPVHYHADIIGQLEPQQWPWPFKVPGNWPEVSSGATAKDPLPIQIVGLPTYAPWLNPIEKLWRYLKQEVVHLHQEENFAPLHDHVDAFLDQFADGSQHLLRCVGLLPN